MMFEFITTPALNLRSLGNIIAVLHKDGGKWMKIPAQPLMIQVETLTIHKHLTAIPLGLPENVTLGLLLTEPTTMSELPKDRESIWEKQLIAIRSVPGSKPRPTILLTPVQLWPKLLVSGSILLISR